MMTRLIQKAPLWAELAALQAQIIQWVGVSRGAEKLIPMFGYCAFRGRSVLVASLAVTDQTAAMT